MGMLESDLNNIIITLSSAINSKDWELVEDVMELLNKLKIDLDDSDGFQYPEDGSYDTEGFY